MENVQKLKEENLQLRRALALCLNYALIKRLSEALKRVDDGDYVSEEEFFLKI